MPRPGGSEAESRKGTCKIINFCEENSKRRGQERGQAPDRLPGSGPPWWEGGGAGFEGAIEIFHLTYPGRGSGVVGRRDIRQERASACSRGWVFDGVGPGMVETEKAQRIPLSL